MPGPRRSLIRPATLDISSKFLPSPSRLDSCWPKLHPSSITKTTELHAVDLRVFRVVRPCQQKQPPVFACSEPQIKKPPAGVTLSGHWLRGKDLNLRPLGYEPNELPDCSTPHPYRNVRLGSGQRAPQVYPRGAPPSETRWLEAGAGIGPGPRQWEVFGCGSNSVIGNDWRTILRAASIPLTSPAPMA